MIRINLIQRKQASYVTSNQNKSTALKTLSAGGAAGILALVKTIGIPIVLSLAANYAFDTYVKQKTEEMAQETAKLEHEKEAINKKLQKYKGFEPVKAELERSEQALRNKIVTIEKLIRGRDFTVKALIALDQAMPKDIWLTDIRASETTFTIGGGTIDLAFISDFMSRLGQTIYFKDVTLNTTASDPNGRQASFELGAKRE